MISLALFDPIDIGYDPCVPIGFQIFHRQKIIFPIFTYRIIIFGARGGDDKSPGYEHRCVEHHHIHMEVFTHNAPANIDSLTPLTIHLVYQA